MGARASMYEEIPTRNGLIRVMRWSNKKITIESDVDFFTPVQAEKLAKALVSCANYCAANGGYSTRTPHPDRTVDHRKRTNAARTK